MSDATNTDAAPTSMRDDARRIASCPSEHASLLERHDGHVVELEGRSALLLTATEHRPAQTEASRFRFLVDFASAQGRPQAPDVVQDLVTAMVVLEPDS